MIHIVNEQNLKWRVMVGIYTLYILRKLKSPIVGELFAFGMSLAALSFLVSLPHVISNMMASARSAGGSYTFFSTAFSNAQLTVKLISLAALAALVLFVRNITVSTTGLIRNRFAH